jgi:transcriptional regulator with XRE-family HTH domain
MDSNCDLLGKYSRQLALIISRERNRHGLTQKQLGGKIKLNQSVVCYLESGKGNPTLLQILRVATFFDLPLAKLFEFSQNLIEVYDTSQLPTQIPREIEVKWHEIKSEEIKTIKIESHRQLMVCAVGSDVYVRVRGIQQMHFVKEKQFAMVPGGYEVELFALGISTVVTFEMPRKEGR